MDRYCGEIFKGITICSQRLSEESMSDSISNIHDELKTTLRLLRKAVRDGDQVNEMDQIVQDQDALSSLIPWKGTPKIDQGRGATQSFWRLIRKTNIPWWYSRATSCWTELWRITSQLNIFTLTENPCEGTINQAQSQNIQEMKALISSGDVFRSCSAILDMINTCSSTHLNSSTDYIWPCKGVKLRPMICL